MLYTVRGIVLSSKLTPCNAVHAIRNTLREEKCQLKMAFLSNCSWVCILPMLYTVRGIV